MTTVKGYTIEPNAYLSGANLCWADLRGTDLSEADLSGADLRGADLCWADLPGANLRGANLSGAVLRGADLSGAALSEVVLYEANLRWAGLSEATGIHDAGHDLRGFRFVGVAGHPDGPMVAAGCRWLTLAEARFHWSGRHTDNKLLHADCLARVEAIAHALTEWTPDFKTGERL